MAEFLIYDKDHWMDKLNAADIEQMRARFPKTWDYKYLARYHRGDIIEVRPDGFWTGPNARGFDQEAFKVVSIPGLAPDPDYMASKLDVKMVVWPGEESGKLHRQETILRRRKFRFAITPPGKIVTLPATAISQG